MFYDDRFDSLIQFHVERIFRECPWQLVKAQVGQESAFNPRAKSNCGAQGILQLMPQTDMEIDRDVDGYDIEGNLDNGIRYLSIQYSMFPEIELMGERLKFALAAYNGGRGYVNKAIELAYAAEFGTPIPAGHKGLSGKWQTWLFTKEQLKSPYCIVIGKSPDAKQMIDYVDRIWKRYASYVGTAVVL